MYICQNCGAQSPKWIGKCFTCGEWNTYTEEIVQKSPIKGGYREESPAKPVRIAEIEYSGKTRLSSQFEEFDRVLGGGFVPGSVTLLGGEPGIGKSTLALQVAMKMKGTTLYVSGEESKEQLKRRAGRLQLHDEECYIFCETEVSNIIQQVQQINPALLVIDSVQTLYDSNIDSVPGTLTQIRDTSFQLIKMAKEKGVPVILIGHITKEGALAGPKILEHMVDTVLQFEGDNQYIFRIVRSMKNRFGSTSELGIFEMESTGLREVTNPSEILISQGDEQLSGVCVGATINGMRPFLIEVQALVGPAVYGNPQRNSTGIDLRRLNMLLAVLEKKAGLRLSQKDVFLNITGGIKVIDPSIDLAVTCAVLSSHTDLGIDKSTCFAAEVGLSGEIRPVQRVDQRIIEAQKTGFKRIFISKYNKKNVDLKNQNIDIITVDKIGDVFKMLFK